MPLNAELVIYELTKPNPLYIYVLPIRASNARVEIKSRSPV